MSKSIGYSKIYHSETEKIYPKIEKYFVGLDRSTVIDIGCGPHKIFPEAFGVDGRALPGVDMVTKTISDIYHLSETLRGPYNVVYSSHTLEHLIYDMDALRDWEKLLMPDGKIILYLPSDDYYDNASNPEHVQRYTVASFVARVECLKDILDVIEFGEDVDMPDKYSFYVVFKTKRSLV